MSVIAAAFVSCPAATTQARPLALSSRTSIHGVPSEWPVSRNRIQPVAVSGAFISSIASSISLSASLAFPACPAIRACSSLPSLCRASMSQSVAGPVELIAAPPRPALKPHGLALINAPISEPHVRGAGQPVGYNGSEGRRAATFRPPLPSGRWGSSEFPLQLLQPVDSPFRVFLGGARGLRDIFKLLQDCLSGFVVHFISPLFCG